MRPTGYYWVKFDWARHGHPERTHWEVASWDADINCWATIGTKQVVPQVVEAMVFAEIGDRLDDPGEL